MFYIMMHLTHFVWHRTYGKENERGNLLLPYGLLFPISNKGSFIIMYHPTDRIIYTMAFATPVMEH